MRNGQRWRVVKIDVAGDRHRVRRIGDNAVAVSAGTTCTPQVHHGYAITVHAAQGTTAQRCHAVLATTGNQAATYVAMTRGRDSNTVYLYDKVGEEGDHEHTPQPADGVHAARRGDDHDAAQALRNLLDRDNTPHTVIDTATHIPAEHLPAQVRQLLAVHEHTLEQVRVVYDKPRLAAEIDWLQAAGGWSPASAYLSDSTDQIIGDAAPGLSQGVRDTARALAHKRNTVQHLHLADDTEKSAPFGRLRPPAGRRAAGPHLIDTAHAPLPWAKHLGEVSTRDTALRRAQHITRPTTVDNSGISEMLYRAT